MGTKTTSTSTDSIRPQEDAVIYACWKSHFKECEMDIAKSFAKLNDRIAPMESEIKDIAVKMSSIATRLEGSFDVNKVFIAGSHGRGTAIRHYSDVDFFAVFPVGAARRGGAPINSISFIEKIRRDLDGRYPKTAVSRDAQAVVVKFEGGSNPVDVVPAVFYGIGGLYKRPLYLIPKGDGEWLLTSPESHSKFIEQANVASGGKLLRVARLLKHWRHCREADVRLSSFHIELLLASSKICSGVSSYSYCLAAVFWELRKRGCRALQDPLGLSGLVPAAKTAASLEKVRKSVEVSAGQAILAWDAERNGRPTEAWKRWNSVFKGNFPRGD